MFGGQWKESSENTVTLEIPDPNIDQEGAKCMYKLYAKQRLVLRVSRPQGRLLQGIYRVCSIGTIKGLQLIQRP